MNLAASFRNEKNSDLPTKSSLGQKTSNIVGQMSYKGSDLLQLDYDFFADNNLGKFNYHKLKSTFKVNNFVSSFEFIEENNMVAATITAHHLMVNRNIMLSKGIRPDFYCAPILKTECDRSALVEAAVSGNRKFFLGTDSAPHVNRKKISSCGCAGIFSSPLAIPLLIQLFEDHDSLNKIEPFMSKNGRAFYGIRQQKDIVRYIKRSTPVNSIKNIETSEGKITVFNPFNKIYWELAN